MEKKNNFMLVMIVILSVSLLGAVSFIVYDKIIKKDEGTNSIANNDNQIGSVDECMQNTIIDEQAYVIEAYNKRSSWPIPESLRIDDYEKYAVVINEAILPKLNINTDNAKIFNSKIMSDYKDVTQLIDTKKAEEAWDYMTARSINYEYFVNDDIVLIMIKRSVGTFRGGSDEYIEGYYYDIKNDKELSVVEVCEKFGITLDKINKKINSRYNVSERVQLSSLDQILAIKQSSSLKSFIIYHYDENGYIIYNDTINTMFD